MNSTLALNGTGFVGAASPDDAVRLAVSGTITLGGLSWLPNPPDTFVFPRDLTANAANGDWQKFRFAADSYNSNTSSWTVTLQFIDDDCRDPWRADFDGSYCRLTVVAGPPRLSLTATDAADATNHATAITEPDSNLATIKDLYVAADSSGAAHIDLSALFGPSTLGGNATGQYLHVSISPSSDPTIDDTYSNLLTAGDLDDIALQTTPTVHDFVITAWLDADRDTYYTGGTDPSREIHVHVVTVDSLTVCDYDDSSDTVTTDDSTVPELAGETNDSGQVHLSFSITTAVADTAQAAKFVGWMFVDPSGDTIARGTGLSGDFFYTRSGDDEDGLDGTLLAWAGEKPGQQAPTGNTAAPKMVQATKPTLRRDSITVTKVLGRKLQIVTGDTVPAGVFVAQSGTVPDTPPVTGYKGGTPHPVLQPVLQKVLDYLIDQAQKDWQWDFGPVKTMLEQGFKSIAKMSINTEDYWVNVEVNADQWKGGQWVPVTIDVLVHLPNGTPIGNGTTGLLEDIYKNAYQATVKSNNNALLKNDTIDSLKMGYHLE